MSISDLFARPPITAVPQFPRQPRTLGDMLLAQMPRMTGHYLRPETWGAPSHADYDQYLWGMEPVGLMPGGAGNVTRLVPAPLDARSMFGRPANTK